MRIKRHPGGIPLVRAPVCFEKGFHWQFGVELRRMICADHRSGWSGLCCTLHFGPWAWGFYLLRWPTPRKPVEHIYTLAQQVRDSHRWGMRELDDDERREVFKLND